jgi:gamma-glutamylcyclotransferase (GGCT)/AIG2-like uncharacterized protein YtfP
MVDGKMTIAEHLLRLMPAPKASAWRKARKENPEYERDGHSVFVYGSLKSDFHNNDVLSFAEFVARTKTLSARYTMLSMGPFPALVETGSFFIDGEIYRVHGETLWTLDIMEGQGDFYDRKQIQVVDYAEPAWCYFLRDTNPLYQNPNCPQIWLDAESNTQKWILPLDSSEFLEEN